MEEFLNGKRGQRCPLSPMLFNLIIANIKEGLGKKRGRENKAGGKETEGIGICG